MAQRNETLQYVLFGGALAGQQVLPTITSHTSQKYTRGVTFIEPTSSTLSLEQLGVDDTRYRKPTMNTHTDP
jgi:hypothetical protein